MSTNDVNSVVATAEATNVNANVQTAQVINATPQAESIEGIVARLCRDNKSKVVKTTITAVECEERTAKNGSKYINASVTFEVPVPGSQKMPDGTYRMGFIGMIQLPFNLLLLVMRKHRFYGKFVASLEEAAQVNMVADYLAGIEISVFCQFVAAGEVGRNPFTRSAAEYDVVDHDRYTYHVIGIEAPTDPLVLDEYRDLIAKQRARRAEAIEAARKAKATTANLLSAATTAADDFPF